MNVVMGFDVGTKRIGVAVGNGITGSAQALGIIYVNKHHQPDWPAIDAHIRQWRPQGLVVGLPLDLEGQSQAMTETARRFAQQLHARAELPVHFQDERHTSQEAARRFKAARAQGTRRRHDANQLDAMAAVIIVENWLAQPGMQSPPSV